MDRRTGIALAATLTFASGLALAACSQEEVAREDSTPAAESQTTAATLPVVTVYKAPT